MLQKLADINFLAVLTAGLTSFFLGAIWYMALFGKLWVKLHGWSDEYVKEMQAKMKPPVFFGGMIASYLIAAFGMAVLVVNLNLTGPADGALLGVIVWLVVAACAMTAQLASQQHIGLFAIDAGFYLVFLLVSSIILTWWRA
ncbi:MAG: DUF1761 domain-containing protein [Planctomycetes bacterium]|nr:DUF1761 domain-containing protein [Planctomycetota bacterium]